MHTSVFGASSAVAVGLLMGLAGSPATAQETTGRASAIEEIVVTAQKREESINEVGMSIQAATGDKLIEMGVTDTFDLFKVVTGFNSNVTYYGTAIYTIRGVGFQDTALASGPTVPVYLDEMPVPFSIMTQGLTLDLQRVEALKGPQGTLFGQNATGGAVNYIANKPTEELEGGIDASYGRFNTVDLQGYLSGPLSDTLSYRVAGRTIDADGWQKTYVPDSALAADPYWAAYDPDRVDADGKYSRKSEAGDKKFYSWRAALQWEPTDQFSALLTGSGFRDEGDTQRPQLYGFATLNPVNGLNPLVADYPRSPKNNRSADWGPCVNVSGGVPDNLRGTQANAAPGAPVDSGAITGEADPSGTAPLNLSNRIYDNCEGAKKDNKQWAVSLRMDYDLNDDMTVTSLTSYSKFDRDERLESDGTYYQDYESFQDGELKAFFQELRLSGSVSGSGSWVVGANYEETKTWDSFIQTYGISTAVPTQVLSRIPLGPTNPNNKQDTKTYAAFANLEYPVLDNVTVQAGVRYTDQKRDYRGCGGDAGDGSWADISAEIQTVLQVVNGDPVIGGLDAGPGNCASTGPGPTYFPEPSGFTGKLDQDNTSWRVGANWEPFDGQLYYANVSKGYKSGSYPTVASAAFVQLEPAVQEKLVAYEIGAKMLLLDSTMQLNAAAFYYDYTDKQVLGAINDFVFGSLPALVNVPKSKVTGGELGIEWYPISGLRVAPSVSYAKSEVQGTFRNFDPFFGPDNPDTKDFTNQPFPNAPKWQANMDVQYEWNLSNGLLLFVGGNVNYQDETTGFFVDKCKEPGVSCTRTDYPDLIGNSDLIINERTLLDLRAGFESGNWRVFAWGKNVTNKYHWNAVSHVNDVLLRYTGMPRTYGLNVSYRFAQ